MPCYGLAIQNHFGVENHEFSYFCWATLPDKHFVASRTTAVCLRFKYEESKSDKPEICSHDSWETEEQIKEPERSALSALPVTGFNVAQLLRATLDVHFLPRN